MYLASLLLRANETISPYYIIVKVLLPSWIKLYSSEHGRIPQRKWLPWFSPEASSPAGFRLSPKAVRFLSNYFFNINIIKIKVLIIFASLITLFFLGKSTVLDNVHTSLYFNAEYFLFYEMKFSTREGIYKLLSYNVIYRVLVLF